MAHTVPIPRVPKPSAPRPIEEYFQVCLLLLIGTGFITLASTGKLDIFSLVFVTAALVLRAHLLWTRNLWQIPERVTSFLGLIYVLIYVADFFLISQNFVTATVHLLLFGMVIKLYSVQRDRDFLYLAILAFLQVLSAAILTVDSVFFASLSLFVTIAVVTFVAFEMRRSAKGAVAAQFHWHDPWRSLRSPRVKKFPVTLSTVGLVLMIGILLFSVGIFFLMPRLSGGYMSKWAQQSDLVSGFSDNVHLGEIGRIQQSGQVVMHVRIENGEKGFSVLLRGNTLSDFDGRNWTNPPRNWSNVVGAGGAFDLRNYAPGLAKLAVGSNHRVVHYKVMMEPIGTNAIFAIPSPAYIFGNFKEIAADRAQAFLNTDRDHATTTYTGISDMSAPTYRDLEAAQGQIPTEITRRYLQLPDLDPRIPSLAGEVTAKSRTPVEKAAAIQTYLSKYQYTLDLGAERPRDPVANFLFTRKAGHCEYFASAMALMLRTQGIPSRIVTGFRGGEYNELTGNYIVRAKDAHSWVEAYIPGVGWYAFDPTPAGAAANITTWSRVQLYIDAMREFWREWVVNYDFLHQRRLGTAAIGATTRTYDRIKLWMARQYEELQNRARKMESAVETSPQRYGAIAVGLICLLLIALNVPKAVGAFRVRRLANNPGKEPRGAASIWYARMTSAMAKRGHRKTPAQTPVEFAVEIKDEALRGNVVRFTKHYERARFGESAEDAKQLPRIYEELVGKK